MPTVDAAGQEIFYRRYNGAPANSGRAPLLLVHGAGGLSMNWPPQLRRLSGTTVYAIDLPGHGASGGQGQKSISAYRACVAAFVEALDLGQVVLAGHSMGGAIALDLALAEPERLAGLVLLGSSARLPVAEQILDGLEHRYAKTAAWLVDLLFGPNADPRLKDALRAHLLGLKAALVLGDFLACNGFDVTGQVGDITLPCLILCGAVDKMTPQPASQYLHEGLANSELAVIEEAGHMVMLEQPNEVAARVAAFLDALDPNGAG